MSFDKSPFNPSSSEPEYSRVASSIEQPVYAFENPPPIASHSTLASAPALAADEKLQLLDDSTLEKCRFCHLMQAPWDFIHPCSCAGPVHRNCLDRYRAVSPDVSAFSRCAVCGDNYEFERIDVDRKCCTPMCKFRFVIVRDVFVLLGLVVGMMFLLGWVFVPAVDTTFWRNRWFPLDWPQRGIDFICGVVLFFAVMGVVGIISAIVRCFANACQCCCQMCYEDDYAGHYTWSSTNYPYYSAPSDTWLFFWFCYPMPAPVPVNPHRPSCVSACSGCNCQGGCSGGGGDCGGDAGVAVLILILVLAAIGFVFSVIMLFILVGRYIHRYNAIVWRYQESLVNRVKDRRVPAAGGNMNDLV